MTASIRPFSLLFSHQSSHGCPTGARRERPNAKMIETKRQKLEPNGVLIDEIDGFNPPFFFTLHPSGPSHGCPTSARRETKRKNNRNRETKIRTKQGISRHSPLFPGLLFLAGNTLRNESKV